MEGLFRLFRVQLDRKCRTQKVAGLQKGIDHRQAHGRALPSWIQKAPWRAERKRAQTDNPQGRYGQETLPTATEKVLVVVDLSQLVRAHRARFCTRAFRSHRLRY
jgi:hypothetical protein